MAKSPQVPARPVRLVRPRTESTASSSEASEASANLLEAAAQLLLAAAGTLRQGEGPVRTVTAPTQARRQVVTAEHYSRRVSELAKGLASQAPATVATEVDTTSADWSPGDVGQAPTGGTFVVYDDSIQLNGDRNWRNNNPGNIVAGTFADNHGAIGDDGTFAIFPDPDSGRNAAIALLESPSYSALTLAAAITRWAPPNENDTTNYIQFVEEKTGIAGNQVIGNLSGEALDALVSAINQIEGGHAGTIWDMDSTGLPDWALEVLQSAGAGGTQAQTQTTTSPGQ